jgi:hypothetical protein
MKQLLLAAAAQYIDIMDAEGQTAPGTGGGE